MDLTGERLYWYSLGKYPYNMNDFEKGALASYLTDTSTGTAREKVLNQYCGYTENEIKHGSDSYDANGFSVEIKSENVIVPDIENYSGKKMNFAGTFNDFGWSSIMRYYVGYEHAASHQTYQDEMFSYIDERIEGELLNIFWKVAALTTARNSVETILEKINVSYEDWETVKKYITLDYVKDYDYGDCHKKLVYGSFVNGELILVIKMDYKDIVPYMVERVWKNAPPETDFSLKRRQTHKTSSTILKDYPFELDLISKKNLVKYKRCFGDRFWKIINGKEQDT